MKVECLEDLYSIACVVIVVLNRPRIVDMRLVFVSNQTWSKPLDIRTTNNGRPEADLHTLF